MDNETVSAKCGADNGHIENCGIIGAALSSKPTHPDAKKAVQIREAVRIRTMIEGVKKIVKEFSDELKSGDDSSIKDKGEQIANAILAFRHLEDAKMRIGKVIQATVGESIYDK